jgi:carbon monoxide dehydrogenase subunit G
MTSTIDSAAEFDVAADLSRCWAFFNSIVNIGGCIPGCESVSPAQDGSAALKVKFAVGYISKTFELRARFKEVVPGSTVSFEASGSDADVNGTVSLRAGGQPGVTTIGYKVQIRPVSALGRTAVTLLGKDLSKRQAEAFALCVKTKLESGRT